MSCGRSTQIDVEAFLIDSGASDFDSFRTHFPECPQCSDAVVRWTAFDLALKGLLENGKSTHPEPDRLETYVTSPETMGEEAMKIENHLSHCMSCQSEIAVLRDFDPALLLTGAGSLGSDSRVFDRSTANSPLDAIRGFFDSLSGDLVVGWRAAVPALAAAIISALGLFWWSGAFDNTGTHESPTGFSSLAEESGPESPLPDPPTIMNGGAADPRDPEESATRREQIAEAPENFATYAETLPNAQSGASAQIQLAEASPPDAAADPANKADGAPDREEPREEILLAALTSLPLPDYSAPPGAESLGWMRQFGAVRAGPTNVTIETRAPEGYAGLTLSASPQLWWSVSGDTDLPIQITIVDESAVDPLLRIEFHEPHSAGLHAIDLAQHGVKLEPGVDYRWFVSLLVDPDRPSRNPVAAGALRVIPEADSRRAAAEQTIPSERGHTLARLGLWYDAYDFFAALSLAHPDAEPLAQYRDRLVVLAKSPH